MADFSSLNAEQLREMLTNEESELRVFNSRMIEMFLSGRISIDDKTTREKIMDEKRTKFDRIMKMRKRLSAIERKENVEPDEQERWY